MKNLKFLFCSLLLVAFSFSVSATSDVQKNTKVELVKDQMSPTLDLSTNTFFALDNVPKIVSKIPQIRTSKSFVYSDVELWNYFVLNSKHYNFYKPHLFFGYKSLIHREQLISKAYQNVPTPQYQDCSNRKYSYHRESYNSLHRLC